MRIEREVHEENRQQVFREVQNGILEHVIESKGENIFEKMQ